MIATSVGNGSFALKRFEWKLTNTLLSVLDLVITTTVTIKLIRARRLGLRKTTDTLIKRMIVSTWEAAIPPTACMLLTVAVYFIFVRPYLLRTRLLSSDGLTLYL